ncbi:saccharopine dehydrogenase [Trypanosoma grayi]|uniref:saccharopine dehydrogenase n=1 Tax=Trypanosoma grayi TaxID=71804 RepID=UPI0004F45C53|nr:saccharopine dehydrogenase [Trypanosoma grayi]KEG15350.1 saccharopine dehydrogenase [Trypanosoma grayi]
MSRELAVVVLGATGYTGQLVCEYLAGLGRSVVGPWAIAGRSEAKLSKLRSELDVNVSILAADFSDPSSLDNVCSRTSVLISCAGPFTQVGMPVVEACVRCGTHYVDSTGEYNFVREVIGRFHEEATKKGVAVVSCCAFDSVPSDLGNYAVHQGLGAHVKEVKAFYRLSSSGVSGGTARSVLAVRDACGPEDMDPYCLVPRNAPHPSAAPTQRGVWYDASEKKLTGPFVMAATNERVVRRTNALLGYDSTYAEAMEGTLWSVVGAAFIKYVSLAVTSVAFLRRYAAEHWLPPAGSGPTKEQKELSWYKCDFIGIDAAGKRLRRVCVSDKRDMYTASGVYIGECALSALEMAKNGTLTAGVLTPMTAFGGVLLRRLQEADVVVEVVDEASEDTTPAEG